MQHKPSCPLLHPDITRKLGTRYALLMACGYINSPKPFIQRNLSILKYGPYDSIEFLTTLRGRTFIGFTVFEFVKPFKSAMRTENMTIPAELLKILTANIVVRKAFLKVKKISECIHNS